MKIRIGFVSNSSSEAFICTTNLSELEVLGKLEILFETSLKLGLLEPETNLEDVFRQPFKPSKKYLKQLLDDFGGGSVHYDIKDINMVIESASDNSLPYELFELIENCFKAQRIHMG